MKPIDTAAAGIAPAGLSTPRARGVASDVARVASARPHPVTPGLALALGHADRSAPVDLERVNAIRAAVAEHRYPLIPHKIADAMIAAPYLLAADKD